MSRFLVLLILVLFDAPWAYGADKFPVWTKHNCEEDNVGQRLVFGIREQVRSSASLFLTDSYEESLLQLSLVCLDPDSDAVGNLSRYSYSITAKNPNGVYDFSLSHGVGTCGSARIPECANSLLASIDQALSDLKEAMRQGRLFFEDD